MFDPPSSGVPAVPEVVLGIDPGLSRCGYGVVRRDGATFRAVAYGVIRTAPSDDLPVRLASLLTELEALLVDFPPAAVAVERVLFQVNTRTAMSVGQASGLALTLAGRAGHPGRAVQPQRGEAGGGGRRQRGQGRGAADGDPVAEAGRAAAPAGRRRRAGARAVPLVAGADARRRRGRHAPGAALAEAIAAAVAKQGAR